MRLSQNGWRTDPLAIASFAVPGTDVRLRLHAGAAATVLVYVAERYNREVEPISNGRGALDDWGYADRPIRGSAVSLSNHASGTAIDLNASRHPLGLDPAATFTDDQIAACHHIIEDPLLAGCVRWGGLYEGRKDPMHWELVATPIGVTRAALRIQQQHTEGDDMTVDELIHAMQTNKALRAAVASAVWTSRSFGGKTTEQVLTNGLAAADDIKES